MDGVVHSSFPTAFWLEVAVATRGRDYSAPISLPTTDTRRRISAIDVLGVTLFYASVRLAPCGGLYLGAGMDIERISFVDALRWLYELKTDKPPDLVVKSARPSRSSPRS
jgi:hypothetical protein